MAFVIYTVSGVNFLKTRIIEPLYNYIYNYTSNIITVRIEKYKEKLRLQREAKKAEDEKRRNNALINERKYREDIIKSVEESIINGTAIQKTKQTLLDYCNFVGIRISSNKNKATIISLVRENYHSQILNNKDNDDNVEGDFNCSICLRDKIQLNVFFPCGHTYCRNCTKMLMTKRICPACRKEIHSVTKLHVQ